MLEGDELARDIRGQIGDTLTRQAGVSATSFAPGASRPVLRGFSGERVRVLTDGIGSIDVSNTSADHAVTIYPLTVERIEILRGPAVLLFGSQGELLLSSIVQTTNQIWDAGSELFDPAAAAFVGNNDLRSPQNSVVAFNFAELAGFNGLTTGAGYIFDSQLAAGQGVYRIDFTSVAVSEPSGVALLAAAALPVVLIVRRRGRAMRA